MPAPSPRPVTLTATVTPTSADVTHHAIPAPLFMTLTCSQCSAGSYRDDQQPDPAWDAPEAQWRCTNCAHPTDIDAMEFDPGELCTVRDHILGYTTDAPRARPTANQPTATQKPSAALQATATEITATLCIDWSESRCGKCNKPTLLSAYRHTDISGYQAKPGAGCGARFVNTASLSRDISAEDLRELRPDLPVRGQDQA
ncbi:hypothetical protein ACFRR6_01780 [Streptomyces sp. NPDC056891]|uniref:hypothetical protein n=1 Tax=Streptomyces sp. NPDC056891 TaxID=3345961 RepID=UPI003681BC53